MNINHARAPPFAAQITQNYFKLSPIPFNSLMFNMRLGHTIARAGCDAMD